jgi:hypothetical protein
VLVLLTLLSACDWRAALVHRQQDKLRASELGQLVEAWKALEPARAGLSSDREATDLLRQLHGLSQAALEAQCADESWSYTHYRYWSMIEQERFESVAAMHADPTYLETLTISELSTTRGCEPLVAHEVCGLLAEPGGLARICG